jgi:hypothetical protein
MFVSEEILVPVGYAAARARLASMLLGSSLQRSSEAAYHEGLVTTLRVGPMPLLSRLVSAEFRELVTHPDGTVLALRWQAAGDSGGLFPVLDADITMSTEGHGTRLRLDGAYRPPLGAGLDLAVMHRLAAATIRSFIADIRDSLADPVEQRTPPATT